jgi:hypothetical protein
MISPHVEQDPLMPYQGPACDPHSFAELQEWPRLPWQSGLNRSLNGIDFRILDGNWCFAVSDHLDDAGRDQDGKPIQYVKSAKQVSRKQRQLDVFDAIGPTPPAYVNRQERLVALAAQMKRRKLFVSQPRLQRVPRVPGDFRFHSLP